jgi:hypothetical protein
MAIQLSSSGQATDLVVAYFARFPNAIVRALNRAGVSTRALMASKVAGDTKLRVGTVRDEIRIDRATPKKPTVRLEIRGRRIPLIEFRARGPVPSRGRGRGVTATLPSGAGRYPHAFIATMRSGHTGVFQRVPGAQRHGPAPHRSQLPIYELRGPSLPHVFAKYAGEGLARGQESLLKNLQSELQFALSK